MVATLYNAIDARMLPSGVKCGLQPVEVGR